MGGCPSECMNGMWERAIKRAWVAVPSRKLLTGSNVTNELMVRIESSPFLRPPSLSGCLMISLARTFGWIVMAVVCVQINGQDARAGFNECTETQNRKSGLGFFLLPWGFATIYLLFIPWPSQWIIYMKFRIQEYYNCCWLQTHWSICETNWEIPLIKS